MVVLEEIKKQYGNLSEYQSKFVYNTKDLFKQVSPEKIKSNSFVKYNTNSRILEILLTHKEISDITVLFLIHEDMIEISCSGFNYYMDSVNNALFINLSEPEFYNNVNEFVNSALEGQFKIKLYLYKDKVMKSEIVWEENKYPSFYRNYSLLRFLERKKSIKIDELYFNGFME